MKKILLIDADSRIPNLALMKLSASRKQQGNTVDIMRLNISYYPNRKKTHHRIDTSDYDVAYCSVIFKGSKDCIHGDNIIFGGTGHDLTTSLSKDIEQLQPDYSIYPDNETSYGFISRGCIRRCKFCDVHKKEGGIHQVGTVDEIVSHKKVKFLDNNFLALTNHEDIMQELINKKIRCQFNQGLDIRLLNESNSRLLSQMKYLNGYIFAFDNWSYKPVIDEKLKLLEWAKRWRIQFFVYCEKDMEISNIVKRIEYLRSKGHLPYVMRNINCWGSDKSSFFIDIASYCNQPGVFKNMTFSQFLKKKHKDQERIRSSNMLYYKNN